MARLEFTVEELVELAFANNAMPNQIAGVETNDKTIKIRIYTGIPFPKTVEASISFVNYINGIIYFKIHTSWFIDKVLRIFPLPDQRFINISFPNLEILIQELLNEKIKNLIIESIQFQNGKIAILTQNR